MRQRSVLFGERDWGFEAGEEDIDFSQELLRQWEDGAVFEVFFDHLTKSFDGTQWISEFVPQHGSNVRHLAPGLRQQVIESVLAG